MLLTDSEKGRLRLILSFTVTAYIALRAYKVHSGSAKLLLHGLLAVSVLLILADLFVQFKNRNGAASSGPVPGEAPLTPAGLPGFLISALRIPGRHALLLLLINRFDGFFFCLYRDYGRGFVAVDRVLVDLALAELLVLIVNRICAARGSRLAVFSGAREDLRFLVTYRRYLHVVFYAAFACVFCSRYLNTTMFRYILTDDHPVTQLTRTVFLVLLILGVFEAGQAESHLLCAVLTASLAIGFMAYRQGSGRHTILAMCILIAAAAGKDMKKLLLIFVIEGLALTVAVHICMRQGILLNLRMNRVMDDGLKTIRYALGSISQTDYAAHLLFTVIAWCMIRPVRSRWWAYLDYPVMYFLYLIAAKLNHATANALLILTVIGATLLHQLYVSSGFRPGKALQTAGRWIGGAAASSFVVFFVLSNAFSLSYTEEKPLPLEGLTALVPNFKSYISRLRYANEALASYPLSLFGTAVRESGNGGRLTRTKEYSFIDISYVRVLLVGGILFTILLIGILTYIQIRNCMDRRYYRLFLMLIISVNCLVEHHIFEFHYIVFPLIAFMICPGGQTLRHHAGDGAGGSEFITEPGGHDGQF